MSENKEFQKVLDKAKALETIEFADNGDFNHEEYYNVIESVAKQNQVLRDQEAEVIINSQAENFIRTEFIEELEAKRKTVIDFMKKYDPNNGFMDNIVEHDIDKIYAISNYLLNAYIQYINEMRFNFHLTGHEVKFINKILTGEIEYNGDEVFNYVQFLEDFWTEAYGEFEKDKTKESYGFTMPIKSILILHHLIKDFKVKGRTSDFKLFRDVLYKIAQTNKVFNAYSIIIERIKSERELWGNSLDHKWGELHPQEVQATEQQLTDGKFIPIPEDEVSEHLGVSTMKTEIPPEETDPDTLI